MRIKPPSRKHTQKAALRKLTTHYWLIPEQPRSKGRLAQLTKANRKLRRNSEFVAYANKLDINAVGY